MCNFDLLTRFRIFEQTENYFLRSQPQRMFHFYKEKKSKKIKILLKNSFQSSGKLFTLNTQ